MANIDERIVKMVFDNKSFEKNVKQTSESLASLKQDLKLEGLATNVQSIADRFSTLGIVGMTVLQDITRMAIDTGKKIANAILSPMMEGGKKRALNIEHAMFQFEGLGMDIEAAMESANTAVLGTAFGLDEAAKVAAQFGASGMEAGEDMTSALTAISGVAAMTGGTYEDIGRIFIKVAGNGRLMGQELLQLSGRGINAAATLANELGITEQEVREMVSAGEISFEMFYRAMDNAFGEHAMKANETFVGAMSNMKAALSRIGADFYGPFLVSMRHVMNTIRPVIDGVRKAIGPLVEYVVTLVDDLSKSFITKLEGLDPSNITQYIQPILTLLENLYSVAKSVLTPIKEAFRNIFPKKSHDTMVNGITALGEFISKFELSAETAKKVGKIFQGFFSIFDTIKNIVVDVAKALWEALGPTIITIGNYILDFGVKVSDVLIRFNEWWKESETLQKVLEGLSSFLKKFVEGALTGITWSLDKIRGLFGKAGAAGTRFGEALSSAFKFVFDSLKKIGLVETLGKLWEIVKSVTSGVWQAVKKMAGGLGEVFKELSFDNVLKTLNTGGFLLLVDSLKRKIDAPGPFRKLRFRLTIFKNIFDTINKALQALVLNIHADSLKKIATAVLILAGGLLVISMIDADRLADSVAAITLLFTNLMGMMSLMLKMQSGGSLGFKGILDAFSFDLMAKSLTKIATAVLILSAALALVSNIDSKDMMKGLAAITAMAAILVATIYALEKIDAKRLGGVAIAMVFFSTSMVIMGKAVANLGKLSWEEIAKGLVSITVLLAAIAGFSKFVNNKKMASVGIGMVAIATSMLIFGRAMRKIAELSWEEIAKGLVGIGGALLVIAGSMKLMPKGSTMLAMSTALIAVGIALQLITRSVKQFGGMSWEQLAKGLIGLAGALLILAGALHAMKGTLSGSAALLVATSSLIILVPVMKSLGAMSWENIIRSLVALAGALTIFGVAAYALQPVTGTLLAMGAAMALFGAGLALVGVGITSAAIGLTTLAGSLAAIALAIKTVIMTIIELIPDIIVSLAKAIADTVGTLKEAIVHIVDLVVTLVVEITKGLVEAVPALFELMGAFLDELLPFLKTRIPEIIAVILDTVIDSLKNIADRIPALVDVGIQVVLGIVEGIANSLDDIAQALINLIVKAINAVTKAISNATSGIATAIADLLRAFVQLIFEVFKALLDLPSGETLPVIETMSTAILALSGAMFLASKVPVSGAISGALGLAAFIGIFAGILAALGSLGAIPGVKELLSNGSALLNQLGGALGEFVGSIIGGFGVGITNALPEIGANLSLFMTQLDPFISGMKKIDGSILASTGTLVAVMLLLTGASLIEGLTNFLFGTRNSLVDFGQELAEFGPYFNKYYQTIKNIKPEVVSASALAAGALAELATNLPKHGGFAQTILGEASLESFGESLVSFGASLMEYQKALGAGLDADLITDSATAAQALSALESNLPSHGGVKSWFMGDADLGSFGVHLEDFGKALKGYHDSLGSGIDSDLITDSATAALALAELEDNLPKQGGIKSWFSGTKSLGKFGENLGDFGTALADYQKALGTKGLDTEMIISSATAAKALSELEDNLPKQGGIKSWFTGSASLGSFGKNLKDFGNALADYQKALGTGLDSDLITASVTAAQALSELEANLPNQNGIKSWFIGGADLGSFGANLKDFGTALKDYQEALGDGIDGDLIVASTNAAGALSELEANLPEHGGVVQFWSGDNTLGEFAKGLAPFGEGMRDFQDALGTNMDPMLVGAAAVAGGVLAELEANLPPHGGVVQFWSGDNTLGEFAKGLAPFGEGMKDFQEALGDGVDGALILNAANAGLALAKLEENLPATGGVVQFWSGDNTLGEFAKGLEPFGTGMKAFHDALGDGLDGELINNAANAGLALAKLEATLPPDGGVVQFWSGSNTLGEFAKGLKPFGEGIKEFHDALGDGIDTTLIDNAANAGLTLAELENTLPPHGGIVSLWSGDASLGEFAKGLKPFGEGMKEFHDALGDGIDNDLIESAANAGLTLAELENTLPKQDGVVSFWSGKGTTLSEFAKELAPFGEGMKAFDEALGDIDIGLVDSAANAGKTLSAIAAEQPSFGGLVEIWGGRETGLKEFGENLELFGESLVKYGDSVESIKIGSINSAMPAIDALVELAGKLEGNRGGLKSLWSADYNFKHLGTELSSFGGSLSNYSNSIVNLRTGNMANVNSIIDELIRIAKDMVGVQGMPMTRFGNDLRNLGETGMTKYVEAFKDAKKDVSDSVKTLMDAAKDAIKDKQSDLKKEMSNAMELLTNAVKEGAKDVKAEVVFIPVKMLQAIMQEKSNLTAVGDYISIQMINAIKSKDSLVKSTILSPVSTGLSNVKKLKSNFYSTGVDLINGFINGINSKKRAAANAGWDLGIETAAATRRAISSKSPSRVFFGIGEDAGDGWINAILTYVKKAKDAGYDMGYGSVLGLEQAMMLIQGILQNGFKDPTIRPVLDLSSVYSGASSLDGLLNNRLYTASLAYSTSGAVTAYKTNSVDSAVLSKLDSIQQNGNRTNNYTIQVDVKGDDLSNEKIKEIAVGVEREIKQMNDRQSFSRGEEVSF